MRLSHFVSVAVLLGSLIGLLPDAALAQDKIIGIGFQKYGNRWPCGPCATCASSTEQSNGCKTAVSTSSPLTRALNVA
jgi:hypothetical protein